MLHTSETLSTVCVCVCVVAHGLLWRHFVLYKRSLHSYPLAYGFAAIRRTEDVDWLIVHCYLLNVWCIQVLVQTLKWALHGTTEDSWDPLLFIAINIYCFFVFFLDGLSPECHVLCHRDVYMCPSFRMSFRIPDPGQTNVRWMKVFCSVKRECVQW